MRSKGLLKGSRRGTNIGKSYGRLFWRDRVLLKGCRKGTITGKEQEDCQERQRGQFKGCDVGRIIDRAWKGFYERQAVIKRRGKASGRDRVLLKGCRKEKITGMGQEDCQERQRGLFKGRNVDRIIDKAWKDFWERQDVIKKLWKGKDRWHGVGRLLEEAKWVVQGV